MALEASYAFGDVGSTTVLDLSGNGRHIDLTSTTGAQVSGGKQGGALGKTGSGMVPLPASLLVALQTDDRSLMYDALGTGVATDRVVWFFRMQRNADDSGAWGTFSLDGTSMLSRAKRASDGANQQQLSTLPVNTSWHNYCLTYKRATGLLTFYRDGAQVAQSTLITAGTQLFVLADSIAIAEWSVAGPSMDNLRLYSHALDAAEVAALAGTEVTQSIVQKTGSEDVASTEDSSVSYALSGSDTSSSADVSQLVASITGSETPSSADVGLVAYALSGSDTGSSSDLGSINVLGAVEALTGTEVGSLAASVLTSDNTSSSDIGQLAAAPSSSEPVSVLDSGSPVTAFDQEDEANATEADSLTVVIHGSEAVTSTEEEDVGNDQLLGDDSGIWVESSSIYPLVEADDVVQGCVKYLSEFPEVTAFLATFEDGEHYLFQYEMQGVVETTSKAAVVISRNGSWSSPNYHNTAKFPRLSVEVWVDPLRDGENNVIEPIESRRRAFFLLDQIDKRLHRPQGGAPQFWGTVRTIESTRLGEPVLYAVPDGDSMLRGQVFYGVTVA